MDTPSLMYALPTPLFFIAKSELRKIPFMGFFMSQLGMIFVDRSNSENAHKSLQQAAKELNSGKSILTFPEGTRSRDGKIHRFKKGSFRVALNSNASIVPVAIEGANNVIPPGKFEIHPGTITVRVGSPFKAQDPDLKSEKQLAICTQNKVQDLLTKSTND